jgi:MarR family transcriptional regulator, organic hydroperoxide resistance regulator
MSQNSIILSEFVAMNEKLMHKCRTEFHAQAKQFLTDMTLLQLQGCMVVAEAGQIKMSDFAKILNLKTSGATQLIDKLVENQIIQRIYSKTDRRSVFITLTNKTKAKMIKIKKIQSSILETIFAPLTESELQVLNALFKKII